MAWHKEKKHYGIAWNKLGQTFPNLGIWYVDTEEFKINKRSWINCEPEKTQKKETLRGLVIGKWNDSDKPKWKLSKTVEICKVCDKELFYRGQNPAKLFREAISRNDKSYINQWVLGCRFPWLKGAGK